MLVLIAGTAAYAAVRVTFRDAPRISIQWQAAAHTCEADLSTFGTPAALALGLFGLIILSIVATPSRSKIVSRLRARDPRSTSPDQTICELPRGTRALPLR